MSVSSSGTEMADSDGSVSSKVSRVSKAGRKRQRLNAQEQSVANLRNELANSRKQVSELYDLLEAAKNEIEALDNMRNAPQIESALPTRNGFEGLDVMDVAPGTSVGRPSITRKKNTAQKSSFPDPSASAPVVSKKSNAERNSGKKESGTTTAARKPVKPPPIIAYGLDAKKCITELTSSLGHNKFNLIRMNGNCTKLVTDSVDDHKKTCELLKAGNADHFTFTPKGEKRTSLVLKGLDRSYDENDIKSAIESTSIQVKLSKISPFGKTGAWLVQLEPQSDTPALMSVKYMLNQRIVFERLRGNPVTQCRRCQRFGHSAGNCHLGFRCMKCLTAHEPGRCQNNRSEDPSAPSPPAACVNCGAVGHPANFRGCPKFDQVLRRKRDEILKKKEGRVFSAHALNNYRRDDVSFAALLRPGPADSTMGTRPGDREPHVPAGNCLSFIEKECQTHFGQGFAEITAKIVAFAPRYAKLSDATKPFELLRFMLSIAPAVEQCAP